MIGRTNADGGIGIDEDAVTAIPYNVLSNQVFYGVGSDEPQKGTMPNKTGTTYRHSTVNDSTSNIGNVSAIKSGGADSSLIVTVTPPAGFYDGSTARLDIRVWGVHEKLIKYGARIGYPNNSGLVGSYTGDANASAADLLSPKTMYVKGQKLTGTMANRGTVNPSLNAGASYTISPGYYSGGKVTAKTLASQTSGNAAAGHILSGKTAWVNGNKITGSMTVNSILSFNAAEHSSSAITFTWTNPAVGPFSGVIIVGRTDRYPASINDGTVWYKGAGNNSLSNGVSSAVAYGFDGGVRYYFSAFSYCTCSAGELRSGVLFQSTAQTTRGMQTFTESGIFTVPPNVFSIDVFCVGGGGGGGYISSGSLSHNTGGGGGGYTATQKGIPVSPGQQFPVTVASAASNSSNGSGSSFADLVLSRGGDKGKPNTTHTTDHHYKSKCIGADGGSGGAYWLLQRWETGIPGIDGGDGSSTTYDTYAPESEGGQSIIAPLNGGKGQGFTTRAFQETDGTLYSNGGYYIDDYNSRVLPPDDNTGHGGFGCYGSGTNGASGVVIIRWGY